MFDEFRRLKTNYRSQQTIDLWSPQWSNRIKWHKIRSAILWSENLVQKKSRPCSVMNLHKTTQSFSRDICMNTLLLTWSNHAFHINAFHYSNRRILKIWTQFKMNLSVYIPWEKIHLVPNMEEGRPVWSGNSIPHQGEGVNNCGNPVTA